MSKINSVLAASTVKSREPLEFWTLLHGEFTNGIVPDFRSSTRFDPCVFEIGAARARLKDAVTTKGNKAEKSTGFLHHDEGLRGKPYVWRNNGAGDVKVVKAGVARAKTCAMCDVTVGLFDCTGCNQARYCGAVHQRAHWPEHKAGCRALHSRAGNGRPSGK